MLRLRDKSKGVPDHFRFTHPEDGFVSRGINWWDMWEEADGSVVKHRKGNGYPPVTEAEVENQLCEQIGPAYCQQEKLGNGPTKFINTRLRFRDIVEGTKAYVALIASGFQTVSQTEADRRARICSGCYLKVQPQGCGACVKIARLITGEIAGKKTTYDSHLYNRACAACSCPVQSIVHFPLALLESADNGDKQSAFTDFCWRKKGGANYLPEAV